MVSRLVHDQGCRFNGDGRTDLFLYSESTGAWVQAYSDAGGGFTYSSGL